GFSTDARESLLDCERWVGRCRRKFEEVKTTVLCEDEICKCAAGIDTDAGFGALYFVLCALYSVFDSHHLLKRQQTTTKYKVQRTKHCLRPPNSLIHSKRESHQARAELDSHLQKLPHLSRSFYSRAWLRKSQPRTP